MEFLGLVLTKFSSTFPRPSRGFFVGVFPSLRVSPVDTYPKLRSVSLMYSVRLCIKVGRGQGDGDIGTRVWGLGTWGRETRDLGTSSMGRGDAGTRGRGDVKN